MDSTNEAKKQYFKFSVVVSFLISFFLNISIIPAVEKSPVSFGFPIDIANGGIGEIFEFLLNFGITFALLIIPIYYLIWWLEMRRGRL